MNVTTPPVYTQPVNTTTPPVYTAPVYTAPVYTPPVNNPQPAAKRKWNPLYFSALLMSIAGLAQTETEPSFAIGAGIIAMVLALIGKIQSGKKNMRGAVVGFIGMLFGTLSMSINLGYANAVSSYDMEYMYYDTVYDDESAMMGLAIGFVFMVIFLIVGRKKKKG